MAAATRPAARGLVAPTGLERATIIVLAAGAALIPLLVDRALLDIYRLPKELAYRTEAIALFVLAALWVAARRRMWTIDWRRADYAVAAAVLVWSAIAVLASTNRMLSADSLVTIVAALIIYLATTVAAQTAGIAVIDWIMVAACANAMLAILQELRI